MTPNGPILRAPERVRPMSPTVMSNLSGGRWTSTARRLGQVLAAAVLGLAIAGCSSSQPGASSSAPPPANAPATASSSASAAGAAYLAAVGPVDAALSAFTAKAGTWTASTSTAQAASDAAPALTALRTFDTALRRQSWPSAATAQVQKLIADNTVVIRDLEGIASSDQFNAPVWLQRFKRDLAADSSTAASLRRELGLPGASPIG